MHISELEHSRVALWGAGREAASTYRALGRAGRTDEVWVVTDAPATSRERSAFVGGPQARFAEGSSGIDALRSSDVIVRSPGISIYRPEMRYLKSCGVRLTTATNLWMADHEEDPRVLVVTGTKGKSTTASLITHMARHRGTHVELAGNIGVPLLDVQLPTTSIDLWVVELSSYQIADLEYFPATAIVLNLYPEHQDWHGSHEHYFRDKLKVLGGQDRVAAILSARDRRLGEIKLPRHTSWFGRPDGYDACGTEVTWKGETVLPSEANPLPGEHNALNICAALTALGVLGQSVPEPPVALKGFQPLPHRLETISAIGALSFVDDSISTTPETTIAALAALGDEPVALIAGGFDRGQSYDELARVIITSNVRAVIGLPETGARLLDAVSRRRSPEDSGSGPQLVEVSNIDDAVDEATQALRGAGVVLLSPAAPSYGRFRSFEERGDRFRTAVSRFHPRDFAKSPS
jgi:UDP-N-acetylmuramoylalanine--D-glutamate ligase